MGMAWLHWSMPLNINIFFTHARNQAVGPGAADVTLIPEADAVSDALVDFGSL